MKRAFNLILIFSLLLTWPALLAQSSQKPALREAVLDLKGQPFKGAASAKLVMVEFFDYQ